MGRPKTNIDYELVESLAEIQCTQEEIASVLKISVRTLQRDEEFCRIYKEAQECGKTSLRRKQWKLADKSYAMAIWLGKQYLGQRELPKEEEKSENGILEELVEAIKKNGKESEQDTESETN